MGKKCQEIFIISLISSSYGGGSAIRLIEFCHFSVGIDLLGSSKEMFCGMEIRAIKVLTGGGGGGIIGIVRRGGPF